jgi:uncharacterized protein YbjQ (UPF0145 family)
MGAASESAGFASWANPFREGRIGESARAGDSEPRTVWENSTMKRHTSILLGCLLCLFAASTADARTTFHDLSAQEAAESEIGKAKLLDVPFYLSGQKHAKVAREFGVFTSNKRTNAFGKSDEAACQIAFLSAIISLQKRATELGGNAVIDIKSITKHNDLDSATDYRCAAGGVIANVVLTGKVVKLEE